MNGPWTDYQTGPWSNYQKSGPWTDYSILPGELQGVDETDVRQAKGALLSGMAVAPVAALGGIVSAPFRGGSITKPQEEITQALSYQAKSPQAQEMAANASEALMAPFELAGNIAALPATGQAAPPEAGVPLDEQGTIGGIVPYLEPILKTAGQAAAMGLGKGVPRKIREATNLRGLEDVLGKTDQLPIPIRAEGPWVEYQKKPLSERVGGQPWDDYKADLQAYDPIRDATPPTEFVQPESTSVVKRPSAATPSIGETSEGLTKASIAKSIEAKAIEVGLIKDGFDTLAGFDPTTMKIQAEKASDLLNADFEKARSVVRGEEPLPEGLRGISLIKGMEERMKANPDVEILHELANSPLASEVSEAGQLLSVTRGRELDSFAAKIAEVKKARESAVKDMAQKNVVKMKLKEETSKINLNPEELSWEKFLQKIAC